MNGYFYHYLAARLQQIDSYDYEKWYAIVEDELDLPQDGVPGLINLTFNMERYDLFTSIFDEEDYGRYIIQESGRFDRWKIEDLLDYIDYEAYGRDASINEGGSFTERGYVTDNQQYWYEEYEGTLESIPKEYRLSKKGGTYDRCRKRCSTEKQVKGTCCGTGQRTLCEIY